MTISYTEEMKLAMLSTGSSNWGAVINGVLEALDAGHELTFTFGETVVAGDAVCLKTDGKIYKSASNDSTLTPAIGFAPNAVTSGAEGKVRWFGWIDVGTSFSYGDDVSFTAGDYVYPGSVAGRITNTQYSWANPIGVAKQNQDASYDTRILIKPGFRWDEVIRDLTLRSATFQSEYDNGSSGAAKTITWTNGNKQKILLTDDAALTFVDPPGPCSLTLQARQDGTGTRVPTWPASVQWPAGTAPTLTTTADAIDILCFYFDGQTYYGSDALDFS